ncbi:unnamed protein product, partial [Brachionus calyciflorus]
KKLVVDNFPTLQINGFDDFLKKGFVEGLANTRLREKCREKLRKTNRLQQSMSFDELLTHAIDKYNGFDLNQETESDSSNETAKNVRFVEPSKATNYENNFHKNWDNNNRLNNNKHRYETRYQSRQANNSNKDSSNSNSNNSTWSNNSNVNLSFRYETRYQSRQANNSNKDSSNSNSNNATWSNNSNVNLVQNEKTNGLLGKAIFNNSLVSYFFDTGASCTIINEPLYVKIKKEDPGTILEPYTGKPLWSCNKKLTVYGQICLRNCQITGDCLKNVTVIVTNHKSQYECLLGRDLMKKVPNFDVTLTNMEKDIKTSAVNITELHNSMIKTENTIEPSEIHLKEEELHDKNRNIQVELTGKKTVVTESINFTELMNLSQSNGENLNSTNDLKVSDNFLNSLKENLQMIIETKTDALKPEINSIEHND